MRRVLFSEYLEQHMRAVIGDRDSATVSGKELLYGLDRRGWEISQRIFLDMATVTAKHILDCLFAPVPDSPEIIVLDEVKKKRREELPRQWPLPWPSSGM